MNQTASLHITARRNRRTGIIILAFVVAMLALAYASAPLYALFCQVTGYGGTTQIAKTQALNAPDDPNRPNSIANPRQVRFNAHVSPELDWRFSAPEKPITLTPGEEITIHYTATNLAQQPTSGTSTFNVTPFKAGPYFMKIECFCFVEQTLEVGETVSMPVTFYLDPEIDQDLNTAEMPEITLSYTFFAVEK